MPTSRERILYWLFAMGVAALAVTGLQRGEIASFGPILILFSLVYIFILGETGRYPFDGRHFVRYKIAYYVFVIIMIALASWIEGGHPSVWCPAADKFGTDVLIFTYAIAAVTRGFRVYSSREWPWPMSYVAGKNASE